MSIIEDKEGKRESGSRVSERVKQNDTDSLTSTDSFSLFKMQNNTHNYMQLP